MFRVRAALAATLIVFVAACSTGDGSKASSTAGGDSTSTSRSTSTSSSTTTTTKPNLEPVIAATPWQLPSARDREVALTDGTSVWLLGGRDPAKSSRTSIIQVDPATGASTPAGDLAVAVHDAAGARLGGKLFVFGGGNSSTVATVQAFTPGAGSAVVGSLPQARSDLTATTVGDQAYVVGGFDGRAFTPDVLVTSNGTAFTSVAALPVPVRYPALAALDNKLYVFGGGLGTSEASSGDTNVIQVVDLAAHTASIVARLPSTLSHATAVTLGGEIFVLGGLLDGKTSAAVWRYTPQPAGLVPAGSLPVPISDSAAVVVHDVAYLLGGESAANAPTTSVATLRLG